MMKNILLLLSFMCVCVMTLSTAQAKGSVKVGDVIPHDLALNNQKGEMQSFSKLSGEKGLVLVFIRSASWCPYCQKQLIELDDNVKKFTDLGYEIASVSYDTQDQMQKFVTTNNPKFTMLSDPRSDSIRAFGILNQEAAKGTMSYGIPYPGTYIVDKNKKVQAMFFKEGYQDRVSVGDIIKKIKELNPPPTPAMTMEDMGQDDILPEEAIIETPEKMMDPIIIPDNFDATNDAVIEEILMPETVPSADITTDIPADLPMPEPINNGL